jgi:hypothetical protein
VDLSGTNGAMTSEDVITLKTGTARHLPRDTQGRTVFFCDGSKKRPDVIPSFRFIFFLYQIMMENEVSRTDGYVVIYNVSNPYANSFDKKVRRFFFFLQCERGIEKRIKEATLHTKIIEMMDGWMDG